MLRRTVIAAALLCAAVAAPAQASDFAWTPAGHLSRPLVGTASAVLADGRVLIIGGNLLPAGADTADVEVYDPRTHVWSFGPSMGEPRSNATAVTLRDGRVLVLGGARDDDQRSAEVLDPATGTWTPAASSTARHVASPAFLLEDGRVLFLGGDSYWSSQPLGEIYDPATDAWTPIAAPHAVGGAAPAVVRMRDGRFLVVGGRSVWEGDSFYDQPLAEVYDVARDAWTVVAPPHNPGYSAGAAVLPDGRVLLAGGHPGSRPGRLFDATAHAGSELFDPATGAWTVTGDLNRPRASGSTLTTLADGRIVAMGGFWATIGFDTLFQRRVFSQLHYESAAEAYDAGTWRATPASPNARSGHEAVPLADGSLLVVGGVSGQDGAATTAAERLVPVPAKPVVPEQPVVTPQPQPPAPKAGALRFVAAKTLRPSRTGVLTLKLRCGGGACSDRLVLRGRGRVVGEKRVTAAAGRTVTVRVKLTAAGRRALRGRSTHVTASLRRQGTKTTFTVRG